MIELAKVRLAGWASHRLLQTLAPQLTRQADRGEDLAAAEEAVAILRELAGADPAATHSIMGIDLVSRVAEDDGRQ